MNHVIDVNFNQTLEHVFIKHIINRNLDKIKELVNNGVDIEMNLFRGNTPLMKACQYGRTRIATYLISKGANINAINDDEETVLQIAIGRCNTAFIKKYLKNTNVNSICRNKITPLHKAVFHTTNYELVKFLIENGADTNVLNYNDDTPLMRLCTSFFFRKSNERKKGHF